MWGPKSPESTLSASVWVGIVHPILPFNAKFCCGTVNTPLNETWAVSPTLELIFTPTPAFLTIVELAPVPLITVESLVIPTLPEADAWICFEPRSGTWNWLSFNVVFSFLYILPEPVPSISANLGYKFEL